MELLFYSFVRLIEGHVIFKVRKSKEGYSDGWALERII